MSTNDKAYKLSLDAFSKLKNDHELFLDAYEKPTQIYRFLKACHALKPLFLHRNLSYLKHRNSRRGHKRRRQLNIDDLINHTSNEKQDLASEIKSGNYLDITVRGLREGIDFKKILGDTCPPSSTHNPQVHKNGQLMEVEVLLYHFMQPSAQTSQHHSSYPCSCTTLGKCIVEYNSSNLQGSDSSETKEKEAPPPSFALPESALSWKGRYGMQLVVFRVTPYNGKQRDEQRKEASKKTSRKSLSNVSLSRLSMANDVVTCLQSSRQKDSTSSKGGHTGADAGVTQPSPMCDAEERTTKASGTTLKSHKVPGSCRRDACIMTDISYGTQIITEQVGAQSSAPYPSQPCCVPLSSTRGYSEKCTSPLMKVLPKNGLSKNGVSLVVGSNRSERGGCGGNRDNGKHEMNGDGSSEPYIRLLIKDSNGSKEEKPLVIRVPRHHTDASGSDESQSEIDVENDYSDGGVDWSDKRCRLPRRSEVQLLIDGDKPPEERVNMNSVPVLVAEEVTSRSTRRSTGTKATSHRHRLNSTQKIAVDPSLISSSSSFCHPPSPRRGSKRSLSREMDVSAPPVAKCPRMNSDGKGDALLPQLDTVDSLKGDSTECSKEPSIEPSPLELTQEAYVAELAMFDARGLCLLESGEYDVLMQQCQQQDAGDSRRSSLVAFAPLSWDTVFGGKAKESQDHGDSASNTMTLKVTFHWRHEPPPRRLTNDLDAALDIKKLREAYAFKPPGPSTVVPTEQQPVSHSKTTQDKPDPPNCTPKPPCVVFNFLYNNNTTQQTELRQELACPWCCLSCGKIYSLLKHMSLCHPRFIFTYMPTSYGSCIDVHVNKLYDGTPTPELPGECSRLNLMQRKKGPVKCTPFTAVLVEKGYTPDEDMTEFLNDGSWKRGINTNRQYYHTQSCTPMFPGELEFDSENDEIPEWQKICSQKMLDEFTDVNRGEKELMKLWNLFAMENRLVADKEISASCIKFATHMKTELIEKRIVYNFMAHLASLFDYGLVTATAVHQSMSIVLASESSSFPSNTTHSHHS